MNKALGRYSLMISLLLGMFSASIATAANTVLTKLDTPVFLFKTMGKDPYFMQYRPGSGILETVTFGYYMGKGIHVKSVTKASEQLEFLIPIRQTLLYEDVPVKIDTKFVGYRESVVGKASEDLLKAVGALPDHYYKGTPFVDQYLEGIPMKWVLNNATELTSLRRHLEPQFEKAQLLEKGLVKPALVLELESTKFAVSEQDKAFLNKYFNLVDVTDAVVMEFFTKKQEQINEAVMKIKDAKQVKEGFFEALFRQAESVVKEGKAKEFAVVIIAGVAGGITNAMINAVIHEKLRDEAKVHAKKFHVHFDNAKARLEKDHALRNALLIGASVLGAGFIGTAACTGASE